MLACVPASGLQPCAGKLAELLTHEHAKAYDTAASALLACGEETLVPMASELLVALGGAAAYIDRKRGHTTTEGPQNHNQ